MATMEERIEIAFSKIGLRVPFVAAAVGRLAKQVSDEPGLTAATNGEWFKFGRKWCSANVQDEEELFGLCYHESLHVVLMHMWRREGRDPAIWNIANDAFINKLIVHEGYKLPKGGVTLPWVTLEMDSEEIYNRLMQEADDPDQGDQDGEGDEGNEEGDGSSKPRPGKKSKTTKKFGKGGWDKQGDIIDAPDESAKGDMEAMIRAAAEMAKACGDSSLLVKRILGTPPKASVNWKDEIRAALTSSARDDFTFRRFSRRFMHSGIYLPSLQSDAMGGLLIGFDTSGSVGQREADQICGEIQGIVDDLNPDWVRVVYCDSVVTSTQHFERGDDLAFEVTGGGGTRFKPVFDYATKMQEEGNKVAALVYLTDMCGPMGELVEPDFPVVWANVYGPAETEVPFGKVVKVIV